MRRILALTCAAIALGGCAQMLGIDLQRSPKEVSYATVQSANAPLVCVSDAQCSLYWQRAQNWLQINSNYKIQSASESVISTYGPRSGDGNLAYSIRKEPSSRSQTVISVDVFCASPVYGCFENPLSAMARAKAYIRE